MRMVLSHLSAAGEGSACVHFFSASRPCLGRGCPTSLLQPLQEQHRVSQCILTDVRVVAGHRPSLSAEKQNLSKGSLREKKKKQPTTTKKKPKPLPAFGKENKKKQPQTSEHFISSAFVLAWIICETNRIHWWLLAMTLPAWNTLVRRSTATEPNNLSQNICNHLTLALTFKSIFSYSSQKTLSMAKETQEKDSSTNKKRYRGNSTQIRWQKIIQFAHFYSAAQTGVEFIFTLSLFMLFKHNIH